MSDTSQGPGWWQASDGKWYAPELYPTDWDTPAAATTVEEDATAAEEPRPAWDPEPESVPEVPVTPEVPLTSEASAPQAVIPDPVASEAVTPEAAAPEAPPTGWSPPEPDPAAGEPTLVQGVPPVIAEPVVTQEPTQVQPAIVPPDSPPAWTPAPAAAAGAVPEPQAIPTKVAPDVPSGLLGFLGAAGLIVGAFLDWAVAAGTLTSGAVNGLTGSNGWGTLLAGLAVFGCASFVLLGQRTMWVGAAWIVAALVGLGLAIFSYIDIGSTSDDLPAILREQNVSAEIADGATLDYDLGMWLVLAGGAISLLAGIMAYVRRE